MNNRYESLRQKALSAVAALMVATFFIGSAVGPAIVAPTAAVAQTIA
jgi:hypothetical protein